MLKFINKDGKLELVLMDQDAAPHQIDAQTRKMLETLGIKIEDEEEETSTEGISQDDLKRIIVRR